MASLQEKGRARTISNFGMLQKNVSQLDANYQPSNPRLTAAALAAKEREANARLQAYNDANAPYMVAANARKLVFAPVSKLLTRVRAAIRSGDVTKATRAETLINADALFRKYRGIRADKSAKTTAARKAEGAQPLTEEEQISVAHLSYVQRANTLQEIIALLTNIPGYNPTEPDLTFNALKNLQQEAVRQNEQVDRSIVNLDFARNALRECLDAPDTGLVDVALAAKSAIVSTYGFDSFPHKQVRGLEFPRERE